MTDAFKRLPGCSKYIRATTPISYLVKATAKILEGW